MGLDTVELVMDIEDEFEITIPDEDLASAETGVLGVLRDYVVARLSDREPPVTADEVWARLCRVVARYTGTGVELRPELHIVHDLGLN